MTILLASAAGLGCFACGGIVGAAHERRAWWRWADRATHRREGNAR